MNSITRQNRYPKFTRLFIDSDCLDKSGLCYLMNKTMVISSFRGWTSSSFFFFFPFPQPTNNHSIWLISSPIHYMTKDVVKQIYQYPYFTLFAKSKLTRTQTANEKGTFFLFKYNIPQGKIKIKNLKSKKKQVLK